MAAAGELLVQVEARDVEAELGAQQAEEAEDVVDRLRRARWRPSRALVLALRNARKPPRRDPRP